MNLIKPVLISLKSTNSNFKKTIYPYQILLYLVLSLVWNGSYSQTQKATLAEKAAIANPVEGVADLISICPDNGSQMPKIFLCGSGASRQINTTISGATISWGKLVNGSCTEVINSNCANVNPTCNWNTVGTGPSYTATTEGQYRIKVTYPDTSVLNFYFNVYTNPVDIPVTTKNIVCGTAGEIRVAQLTGYEYSLDGGAYQTSNVFAINTPKTYIVNVRRVGAATDCVFTIPNIGIITEDLSANANPIPPDCNKDNVEKGNEYLTKGSIKLTASNSNGQYYYKIFKNGTLLNSVGPITSNVHTFEGLDPGDYTWEVKKDGCSTPQKGSTTISPVKPLSMTFNQTTSITTKTDGIISVKSTTGGTSPYSYYLDGDLLKDINTTPFEIAIKVADYYNVTVKDSKTCYKNYTIEVSVQPLPVFTVTPTPVKCYGDKGEIIFTVTDYKGNTLLFSIDNGVTYSANTTFSNLAAGTYKTVVKYTLGKSVSETKPVDVKIIQPKEALTATAGVIELAGCGPAPDTNFGKIQITNPQGGKPPYLYSFDNQATWTSVNTAYKAPGTYTLYIKDANECFFALPKVILEDIVKPTIVVTNDSYNCDGTANSTVTVTSTQSANYTYTYSLDGDTAVSSNSLTNVSPGEHKVTVYSKPIVVPSYNDLLKEDFGYGSDTALSPAPDYCFEDQLSATVCGTNSYIADGEYSVTAKVNYLFGGAWFPIADHTPPTTPIKTQGRFLVANIKAETTYPIIYQKTLNSIIPNEDLKIELYAANLFSSNYSATSPNLKIAIEDTNGNEISSFNTGAIAKNQSWNFINGILKPGLNTSVRFVIRSFEKSDCGNDVAVDDIKAYQFPAKLCEFPTDEKFTVPTGKAFSASITGGNPVSCNNLSDGKIEITATNFDAAKGYQYSTDNGTTWQTETTSPYTIKGLSGGKYKIKVRYNSTGSCEKILDEIEIINPAKLETSSQITNKVKCNSNGTITATSTGGTGSYRFELWDKTNTTKIRAAQDSGIFTNVPAGSYIVRGLDAKGCSSAAPLITLETPAAVAAEIDKTLSDLCYDSVDQASLAVKVTSGTAPYSYSLDGGANSQTDNIFKNVGAGNYTIKVTDSNNCSTEIKDIIIGAELTAEAALTKTVDCTSSPDATITVSFKGGVTPLRYQIKKGTTTITTSDITPTTATSFTYTVSEANAGAYSFIITDANNCSKTTNEVTVSPKVPPVISSLVPDPDKLILCNGDQTASIKVTLAASTGVSPFTYEVKNTTSGTSYGSQLSGLPAGSYTVKVTDSKACSATGTTSISQPDKLVVQTDSKPITCAGAGVSPGEVIVKSVTGGTSPYNYYLKDTNSYKDSVSNKDGTSSFPFSINNFGVYEIKVVDKNNCTALVQDIKIASPPNSLEFETSTTIDCSTGGTAIPKIPSTVTSAGPFYFSIFKGVKPAYPSGTWQAEDATGSRKATFTGLLRGVTYTFVVYDDATKCYASGDYKIPTDSKLVVENLVPKPISCKGFADGKVTVKLKSPYATSTSISYQIYNSQTLDPVGASGTATISANSSLDIPNFGTLAVGNYFVLIKETSGIYAGCSIATQPFSITESLTDLDLPDVTKEKNANCKENGVISVKASGGTGPYMYSVSSIAIVPTTVIIPTPPSTLDEWTKSNSFTLAEGTYTVFVKDAYDCVKQKDITVAKDTEPKIDLSVTDVCSPEGKFEIKVGLTTAGIAPHYLSVNSAALEETTFPYTLTSKNSGDYSITVQDKNGCTNTQTKTILKPLSLSSKVVQLPSCYINDGKFDVFATGGSGSFEYKLDSGSFSTLSNFTGLAPGKHTVQVKDLVTNCSKNIEETIEGATAITGLNYTSTPVSCKGGTNGTITATIATPATGVNNNPDYKFSLNGGTPQTSNSFSGLTKGSYTLKVISARGCEASINSIEIKEPNAIVFGTPTAVQYNCGSTNSLNFATVTVNSITGGSGNYVQYDFFRNGTLFKSQASPTFIETDFLGGNYTVNVYDNIGCMGSSSPAVTIKPYIKLEKIKVTTNKAIDCNTGENITISVEGKPSNPTNLEFTLLPRSGALAGTTIPVNTTGAFTGLAVGDYLISVKNLDTGCFIDEIHTVKNPNTFELKIDSQTEVSCFGGSNGSAKLTLIDNSTPSRTGAFSYQLKDSLGNSVGLPNSSSTNSVSITGLKAGIYTITATLTGVPFCPVTKVITIVQPSQELKLNTSSSAITCVAGNNDGTISGSASGGWSAEYQYQLQNGVAAPTPWSLNPDFKGLTPGNYTLKVRDYKGCEVSSLAVPLSIPKPISFTANTNMNTLNCNGDKSAKISVINPLGGFGSNYSYILNQISPKTEVSLPQITNLFTNLSAGTYTVTVKDPWTCSTTLAIPIEINEPTKVVASLAVQTLQTCTIQTELKLVASGGNGPYTYSADGVAYSGTPFVSSSIIPVGAGAYQYYVKDSKNCESVISNAITIEPLLGLSLTINPVFAKVNCKGESTAAILATAKGGLGDYFYTLLNEFGGTVRPTQASGTFSGLPAGKYQVKVQSADCSPVYEPITVTEPLVKLSATYDLINPLCAGTTDGSIKVIAVGGTGIIKQAISPNLNQFFESNVFENLGDGTYDILVQDVLGCFVKDQKELEEPKPIDVSTISTSIVQEICFDDKTAAFSIKVAGGTLPYKVYLDSVTGSFTTGTSTQTQFDFKGLSGGSHTVYIEDAKNCTADWTVDLDESVKLSPIGVVNYDCVSNTAANKVTVELDSSITDFSLVEFALDGLTYQASNTFINLAPGDHFVRVKHSNGCIKDTPVFNIKKTEPLQLSLKQGGLNEIIALATGGGGPYKFTFNGEFTDTNNSYIYYSTQNYLVKVQDINGCITSATKRFEYIDICIPNYFTPNGDGFNDTWSPGCTINYKNLSFTVFDRYGREIQIFKFGESWNGKYKGAELPSGDYWYVLKLNNSKDDRDFVGHFTLYR